MVDFWKQYYHPFVDSDLIVYPIVQFCVNLSEVEIEGAKKKEGETFTTQDHIADHFKRECEAIFRYIYYRYHPQSPVFAHKKAEGKRDEEALIKSEMSKEVFDDFQNPFLLSCILAFLQDICDYDWDDYVLKQKSYSNMKEMIAYFQQSELLEKEKLGQTGKLREAHNDLKELASELKSIEKTLFGYGKGEETATAVALKRYAPRWVNRIEIDLLKFPSEYFADKIRDTLINQNHEKERAKYYRKENGEKPKNTK